MTFKEQVHKHCVDLLNQKIILVKQAFSDLKESASNETKSTAGDKHETALAMLQIEQENINKQLENLLSQKILLQRIDPAIHLNQAAKGSLIKTNRGYFYLSIALGKITVAETTVIVLSPQSPLGSKLIGLSVDKTTSHNAVNYSIEHVG